MILNKSSRRILKKRSSKRRKSRKRRNRRIKISGGASSLKGAKWTKGWINGPPIPFLAHLGIPPNIVPSLKYTNVINFVYKTHLFMVEPIT